DHAGAWHSEPRGSLRPGSLRPQLNLACIAGGSMASRDIIGPQDRFERMGAQRLRDIRPFSTRLWDVLMSEASALFLSGAAIAMFVEPALVDVFVPGSI